VSWKNVALGEVCTIVNGGTPKSEVQEYWNGDLNWITPKEMGKLIGKEISSTERKITVQGMKNSSAKLLPVNSIILSSRAPIGHLAINKELMATNQGCKGLVPNKKLNYEYLYHFLYSSKVLLNDMGSGTTFKELSGTKLATLEIPLPSLATQQKIVAKLDAIFAEIDTATAAAEANAINAEALFQSFLDNLFFNISKTNNPIKLSSVIKLEYGKGLEDNDRDLNGIYGAYGANGVKSKTNKFLYDKPSIVVGRKGSAGELTLVEEKFWALDVTYYVTHDTKNTDLNFLYYALKMLKIPSLAKGIKPGINRNDVYDLSIAVPILSEQKVLVEKILYVKKNLDIAKNLYKTKVSELNFLKQSILQQAFNGELVKD